MKLSKVALLLSCALVLGTGVLYYPKWQQRGTEATLSWDVLGYYLYLPAVFIYGDVKQLAFRDKVLQRYQPTPDFQQAFRHASGNYVIKYPAGQALLYSPFFFAGHFIAKKTKYLNDGFSYPYQMSIGVGMLLIACLGLWVLRKILLYYFSDAATALTLLVIAAATNYLNYAAIDGAMTHNTLFTLYALLLWQTIAFYKQPSVLRAALIGLLAGLMALTRPTEILACLLFLGWGVAGWTALKSRLRFFLHNLRYGVTFLLVLLAVGSIQLFYWKYVANEWVVYSYEEGFDWLHPHWWHSWFSAKGGWLLYSPVLLLIFPGFVMLYRQAPSIFWPALTFFLLFAYLCMAWQNWWYGGSLGIRAMVQAYPVLAFPLAGFFQQATRWRYDLKMALAGFLLLGVAYNLWLTHQAHKGGLLRPGEMTWAYYKAIFLRNRVPPETVLLLDNEQQQVTPPRQAQLVYENNFDTDTTTATAVFENNRRMYVSAGVQFTPEINFQFPFGTKGVLRASALFFAPQKEWNTWRMCQFIIKFYNGNHVVQSNMIRVFRLLQAGEEKRLYVDALLPGERFDRVAVYLWNADSDATVYMDDLRVYHYTY
jgi:hypothetical protein